MDEVSHVCTFEVPQILQKRSAMKATPIFILVLVAFPIQLLAQESNDFKPKEANYYAKRYFEVESPAKHIVDSTRQSNRKGASPFKEPVVVKSGTTSALRDTNLRLASTEVVSGGDFKGGNFSTLQVKPLQASSYAKPSRVALSRGTSFRAPYVASSPIQENAIEIASPDVNPGIGVSQDQIVRPTPGNSASDYLNEAPSQPSVSDSFVEAPREPMRSEEPQRDTTYDPRDMSQNVLVEPESVSLDHLRISQQNNGWTSERPNTMRHITDNFSPGGEPFAQRGIVGDANFFGVDRRSCCDEWDFCNCSGGLKNNPGHLGIPWLRNSKEPCDSVNPILGRHKAKKAAKCGCSQCVSNDCGCGQ